MKTFQLEGKSREVAATSADQKRALKAMLIVLIALQFNLLEERKAKEGGGRL